MKNVLEIILGILMVGVIIGIMTFSIIQDRNDYNDAGKNEIYTLVEENIEDEVIINNGKIKNENLIDEFLSNVPKDKEMILKIRENDVLKELKYFPGDITYLLGIPERDYKSWEDFGKKYGYYELLVDGNRETAVDASRWQIKRATHNGKVNLYFYTYADTTGYPIICEYDLEDSNYRKDFEITFNMIESISIKKIIDKEESDIYDFNIYTFGGDVTITIEEDMVYNFKDALEQKVITIDDILAQGALDKTYRICEEAFYKDGGSIEYLYPNYTILKYNTLSGEKDFVIGPQGQIINSFNKVLNNEF